LSEDISKATTSKRHRAEEAESLDHNKKRNTQNDSPMIQRPSTTSSAGPIVTSENVSQIWKTLEEHQIVALPYDLVIKDEELLDAWGTIRAKKLILLTGTVKLEKEDLIDTNEDLMLFITSRMESLAKGSEKLIDLSSLAVIKDIDSNRVKVQIGIIGQEHIVDFAKSFCPDVIEWETSFQRNVAISDSIPTWGSIGLGKYSDTNIRKAIEKNFGKEILNKIQFISLKSNVTTIFWTDCYAALKITNTYFTVISDTGKKHFVHYSLGKDTKSSLPQIRLKNIKKRIEQRPLLDMINLKLKPLGIVIECIELSRNTSQRFLGFVTVYIPKNVSPDVVISALDNQVIFGEKITAAKVTAV